MMSKLYYIHNIQRWGDSNAKKLIADLTALGLRYDQQAAIGEGAGGSGYEVIVEVLFKNPISTGVLSAAIWDLVKVLWSNRPVFKQNEPLKPLKPYRLVIHDDQGRTISIDLGKDISKIELALNRLPDELVGSKSRFSQEDDGWKVY